MTLCEEQEMYRARQSNISYSAQVLRYFYIGSYLCLIEQLEDIALCPDEYSFIHSFILVLLCFNATCFGFALYWWSDTCIPFILLSTAMSAKLDLQKTGGPVCASV